MRSRPSRAVVWDEVFSPPRSVNDEGTRKALERSSESEDGSKVDLGKLGNMFRKKMSNDIGHQFLERNPLSLSGLSEP